MINQRLLLEIINLCLSIDQEAVIIYDKLSVAEKEKELKQFWQHMAAEEQTHVDYWKELLFFAKNTSLPTVFDNPVQVKKDLEIAKKNVSLLLQKCKQESDITNSFLLALNLEFHATHPAFAILFNLISEENLPAINYDKHIDTFLATLNNFGKATPELTLLGTTIKRLWSDNKLLSLQNTLDPLTKVLNRRGLFNAINVLAPLAKRKNYNIGMMMIDVDNFKQVNDTHGHQQGDFLLKKIATIIQNTVRTSDVVGRYGGEEFLAFFPSIESNALPPIAEKIRHWVEQETKQSIPTTISIGISNGKIKTDTKIEISKLIDTADKALYKIKTSGKNGVMVWD